MNSSNEKPSKKNSSTKKYSYEQYSNGQHLRGELTNIENRESGLSKVIIIKLSKWILTIMALPFILLVLFALIPNTRIIPSMLFMRVNNIVESRNAILETEQIEIKMPAGKITESQHWYPFVMRFNASGSFSSWSQVPIKLDILYNFGDFKSGSSLFYERGSVYEGAFYGAYVIKETEKPFTYLFDVNGLKSEALEHLVEFDYGWLVLDSLGATSEQRQFSAKATVYSDERFADRDFMVATSEIQTNSPAHRFREFRLAYLQFGIPPATEEGDFQPLTLYSRVWITRLEDQGVTLVLFAMAPDQAFLEEMSSEVMHRVKIEVNQ